jgi:uncharacterized membrane protein
VSRELVPVPKWAVYLSVVLALAGLGLSIYLTITHFDKQLLACSSTGLVDCSLVTTSAQSNFLGVPVAFLGLGNFVVLSALMSPWAWASRRYWVHVARFALTVVSMGFVIWLIYAELIILDHICLYCSAVHVVTFLLFVVVMAVGPRQLGWVRSEDGAVEGPAL